MNREHQYTSTANKLLNNINRLKLVQERSEWHPISLQLAPTEKCNLNCEFCSVKNRGNKVLPLSDIKKAINDFISVGPIKSIEITGGGEPTLYPEINELIKFAVDKDLQIGLITNGIELDRIEQYNLDRLTWLRISLNGLDYDKAPIIPDIKGTLGMSYVWNNKSTDTILTRIYYLAKLHNAKYVRIVPDCLIPEEQIKLRTEVKEKVFLKKYDDKIFVQTKGYEVYPKCWIGGLKPFLYTDGYIYQCSAVALYERKFDSRWRICHMKDIKAMYPSNYNFPDNSMCETGKCFYYSHNKMLDDLQQEVEHDGFI